MPAPWKARTRKTSGHAAGQVIGEGGQREDQRPQEQKGLAAPVVHAAADVGPQQDGGEREGAHDHAHVRLVATQADDVDGQGGQQEVHAAEKGEIAGAGQGKVAREQGFGFGGLAGVHIVSCPGSTPSGWDGQRGVAGTEPRKSTERHGRAQCGTSRVEAGAPCPDSGHAPGNIPALCDRRWPEAWGQDACGAGLTLSPALSLSNFVRRGEGSCCVPPL